MHCFRLADGTEVSLLLDRSRRSMEVPAKAESPICLILLLLRSRIFSVIRWANAPDGIWAI